VQAVNTTNNKILASGVTDANGEAILAAVGLPLFQVNTSGTGGVTTSTTPATVTAYFAPANWNLSPGVIPDPDSISTNLSNSTLKKSPPQSVNLSSGNEFPMSFSINFVPPAPQP
jgi:hypothetical protein